MTKHKSGLAVCANQAIPLEIPRIRGPNGWILLGCLGENFEVEKSSVDSRPTT